MVVDKDGETKPKPFVNLLSIAGQIVFPMIAGWMGVKAIWEQKASIRLKGSSSRGREELMLGQDAIEFGIGLLLFAFAAHILLYKHFLPPRYHTAIVWIFRVAGCGGLVCWGLSSM